MLQLLKIATGTVLVHGGDHSRHPRVLRKRARLLRKAIAQSPALIAGKRTSAAGTLSA